MAVAGMKTACGNYIIESIIDVGPTELDDNMEEELNEGGAQKLVNELRNMELKFNGAVEKKKGRKRKNSKRKNRVGCSRKKKEYNTKYVTKSKLDAKKKNKKKVNSVEEGNENVLRKKRKYTKDVNTADAPNKKRKYKKDVDSTGANNKKKKFTNNVNALDIKKEFTNDVKNTDAQFTKDAEATRSTTPSNNTEAARVEPDSHLHDTVKATSSQSATKPISSDIYLEERPYMCSECHKTFAKSEELTSHKSNDCSGSSNGFICHRCNRGFFSSSGLTTHSKIHWDPRFQFDYHPLANSETKKVRSNKQERYKCSLCPKAFPVHYSLMLHRMIHASMPHASLQQIDSVTMETDHVENEEEEENDESARDVTEGENEISVITEKETKRLGHKKTKPNDENEKSSPKEKQNRRSPRGKKAKGKKQREPEMFAISESAELFHCPSCYLTYITKDDYDNHLASHENSNIIEILKKPSYCDRKIETEVVKQSASDSNEGNISMEMLQKLKKKAKEKGVYICKVCKIGFHAYSPYLKHMNEHMTDNPYLCGVCNKSFKMSGTLGVHMKMHTLEYQKFICKTCGKELSSHSKLVHHNATTHMARDHKCGICGKGFFRSWHLKEHVATHTGDEAKECDVCGIHFAEIGSLRKHMWSHLKEAKLGVKGPVTASKGVRSLQARTGDCSFPCDQCPKVYHSRHRLMMHKRSHSREMLIKCNVCQKEFFSPSELNRHMRTHTGERPFQCGECGKSFALSTTLKDHIRSHTGEKPFKCFMCSKSFSSSSILGRHKLTHIGRRKYECDLCDKSFLYNASLQVHRRTHSGEKPFQCDVCEKTFSNASHFRAHMRIHTGETPYQCEFCPKAFRSYGSHHRHVRQHKESKDKVNVNDLHDLGSFISLMKTNQIETEAIEDIT